MTFVDKIARHIQESNIPLQHLTVVLPSERMKKYLHAALYKAFQKPILSPELVTIDQWFKSLGKHVIIDKTRALIELYKINCSSDSDQGAESFDEFLAWGEILLSDFNEIDRYLLNAEDVFRNLADIKEIEGWSFGEEELSEGQKKFMEFWDKLPSFYFQLNENLRDRNQCYSGGGFRYVSENIDVVFKKDKERQFIFAGFNA